eukprot:1680287-Amphidinium_carterae.1
MSQGASQDAAICVIDASASKPDQTSILQRLQSHPPRPGATHKALTMRLVQRARLENFLPGWLWIPASSPTKLTYIH